jgi:DNA invertase Pin-like site-specific DNA recombinase
MSRAWTIRFTSWINESFTMKILVTTAILLSALSLAASEAHAQTIKKWVDEEGITHYSDQKPVNDGAEFREVEIPEASVSEYESNIVNERINNQLQQMQQDREAREREAEARERARAANEALKREPIIGEKKREDRGRRHSYRGPFPRPLPGPFPKPFPQQNLPSGGMNAPGS